MNSLSVDHSQRNSSIELLRIMCMMFIVGLHVIRFGVNAPYRADLPLGGADYMWCKVLDTVFSTAVDTFVLISGYFAIRFKPRKILKIWMMVLCYSYAVFIIKCLRGGVHLQDIKYLLPITSRTFWFISVYFVLCLLSPLINEFLSRTDKRRHALVAGSGVLLVYGWATVSYLFNFAQMIPDYGGGIINFVTLYLIGRYIRLYVTSRRPVWMYVLMFLAVLAVNVVVESCLSWVLGFGFSSFQNNDSVFTVAAAVLLLLTFRSLRFHSKVINLLATNCLAVFVFHMNDVVMPWLSSTFHLPSLTGFQILWACIYIPAMVYLAGVIVEAVRKWIFGGLEDRLIDRLACFCRQRMSQPRRKLYHR